MRRPKRIQGGRIRCSLRCRRPIWEVAALLRINRSAVLERALQAEVRQLLHGLLELRKKYELRGDEVRAQKMRALIERVKRMRRGDAA